MTHTLGHINNYISFKLDETESPCILYRAVITVLCFESDLIVPRPFDPCFISILY